MYEKTVFVNLNYKDSLSISFAKMLRRLASVIEKEGGHDQIQVFFYIFSLYICSSNIICKIAKKNI